jgi:hypothetical protein
MGGLEANTVKILTFFIILLCFNKYSSIFIELNHSNYKKLMNSTKIYLLCLSQINSPDVKTCLIY